MLFKRGSFALFLTQLTLSFGTVAGAFALNEAMPTISQTVNDILENFNEPPRIMKRRQPDYFPHSKKKIT